MEINNNIVENDLRRLDQLIDMVIFEYSLFIKGEVNNPPLLNESIVKNIINKYRSYQIKNFALRNKYNNLSAKYYSFRNKWKNYNKDLIAKFLSVDDINKLIDVKINNLEVNNPDRVKELIRNKLIGLVEDGHKFKDFDIFIENNKIEVKVS